MYCEAVMGSLSNRGHIIQLEQLNEMAVLARSKGQELYRSYYDFSEDVLVHMKTHHKMGTYRGPASLSQIVLDVDKGKNSDEVTLTTARLFWEHLHEDWHLEGDDIHVWFSGTGYHFVIPDIFGFTPGKDLPLTVKETLIKHFPGIDPKPLNHIGLIRVGNTVNLKSDLFKIPLGTEELFNKDYRIISGMAKAPRLDFRFVPFTEESHGTAREKIVTPQQAVLDRRPNLPVQSTIICTQGMYAEGGETPNTHRHERLLRMISAWKKAGIPRQAIEVLALDWARSLEKQEVYNIIDWVFTKGNPYSCNDWLMRKYCDPACVHFRQKDYNIPAYSATQLEEDLVQFVRTDWSTSSFDLNEIYDLPYPFRCYPGELIIVWGDTGVGKSTWVKNLAVFLSRMEVLWFALENHKTLEHRRSIQIAHNMTAHEVVEYYKTHENALSNAVSHIKTIFVRPELSKMREIIAQHNPDIVVVDTLDSIAIKGVYDTTARTEQAAITLKEMASQLNTIIIAIHHISKSSLTDWRGQPKALTVHSGKGSSSIEQKADKVIAIEGNPKFEERYISTLKARDGAPLELRCRFNKETCVFTQIKERAIPHAEPDKSVL